MNFQPLLDKLRAWWETSDRTQKIVSIGGAALLIVLMAAAAYIASRPRMEPIFPGASPTEQGVVRDAVVGYGFPAEISPRGDVMVPADRIPEIKIRLSQEGKLPAGASAPSSTDASKGSSLFMTPAEQDQEMKAKKESELEKSIMTLSGVRSAKVHINFGKDSPFGDQKEPPTAVVNVMEQPGTSLTQSQGAAIARLVQNSVAGLQAKGVSVINSQGQIIVDGDALNSGDADAIRKLDAEKNESRRREKEIQRRLDQAFGPGATLAQVSVELNMDDVQVEETKKSPSQNPEARDSVSEEMTPGASGPRGVAGIDANPPGQPAAPVNGRNDGNYKAESSSERFATDLKHTLTKRAAGRLESMNVTVLVDTGKVKDLRAVQAFVDGVLATKSGRNFTSAVVPTAFSTSATDAQKKAAEEAAMSQRLQQVLGLLPILALLAVAYMIMRALSKSASPPSAKPVETALPEGYPHVLPGSTTHLELALPGASAEEEQEAELPLPETASTSPLLVNEEPQYDLSSLDDLDLSAFSLDGAPSERTAEEIQELKDKITRFDIPEEELPIEVREIRERVDVPLERIRRMAKERPETVATLLKSWLMEEH